MAEALSGIALTQLVQPGCPVVFGSFLSNTDMKSGSPSFGTPESAIGLLCTGQIARHFDLPWRSGGGLTVEPDARRAGRLRGADDDAPDLPRRRELRDARGGLARGRARLELREVHRRHRDPADAEARVQAARGRRGLARVRRARGGRLRRALPRRGAHARALPRPASTGRCSPPPRTSTAGRRTAAPTPPSGPARIAQETLDSYEQPPIDDSVRDQLRDYVARRRIELGDEPIPSPSF